MSEEQDKSQTHKHSPPNKKILIRYGKNKMMGWFTHNEKSLLKDKNKVVIKTERGLEIGEVVGQYCLKAGSTQKSAKELRSYYECENKDLPIEAGGKFVRYANEQDLSEERHINVGARNELKKCIELTKEKKLPMKLIDVEHVFGGERIIFYFTAEERVDFRELVKQLAREYQTRIEMRQVGSRDAAKVMADIETCGQPCCCQRYLKILKPVNMKMAKLQKATLDPSKISGYCGRLKCCLRYEDDTYRDLNKRLPKKRSRVKTPQGEGIVLDGQILTQLVRVRVDDGSIIAVAVEDIESVDSSANKGDSQNQKKPSGNTGCGSDRGRNDDKVGEKKDGDGRSGQGDKKNNSNRSSRNENRGSGNGNRSQRKNGNGSKRNDQNRRRKDNKPTDINKPESSGETKPENTNGENKTNGNGSNQQEAKQ